MSDHEEKPCGEYHPLPCGLDEACGFTDHHVPYDDLREKIEEWRARENDPYGMNWDYPADELEELIDE